ncbi:hypothetical protein LMF89_23950 [Pelosinus sp. Bkl1]|uniref:Uncharacterized protein n=1 Tax=Pelosinus baikalensis TaxID=2892015 RepID=A0ABS8HYZ7_9FIRM|nr:hypothetical protein [Pelosinus baikalensis]
MLIENKLIYKKSNKIHPLFRNGKRKVTKINYHNERDAPLRLIIFKLFIWNVLILLQQQMVKGLCKD